DEDAAHRHALGLAELGGHLEVEHVHGVVLDDLDHTGATVGGLHGGEDRLGAGRGEHRTRYRGVEHADADEPRVQRIVTAAAPGHEPDLAADRTTGSGDEDRVLARRDDVAVR